MIKDLIIFILASAFAMAVGKAYMNYVQETAQQIEIHKLQYTHKADSTLMEAYVQHKINTDNLMDIIKNGYSSPKAFDAKYSKCSTYKEYCTSKLIIDSLVSYENE